MLIGTTISPGVAVDVGVVYGTERHGSISVKITAFSDSCKYVSMRLSYKPNLLGEWRSDMKIVSSNARFVEGDVLHGLPCSHSGSVSIVTWNHSENGVAAGSHCFLKAEVVPSATVMCSSGKFTWFETICGGGRIIEGRVKGKAVGIDRFGNAIVSGDRSFQVVSMTDGSLIFELDAFPMPHHPSHAIGFPTGGILARGDNGLMVESDRYGNVVRSFDASGIALGSPTLAFDEGTGNVLVSGGNFNWITELSWSPGNYGTALWGFGNGLPVSGLSGVNSPMGVAYGKGAESILVCDRGNGRILSIDRSCVPQSVVAFTGTQVDGVSLVTSDPAWCAASGNAAYVCELLGKTQGFSQDPSSCVSLARAGVVEPSGGDSLPQYSGMCFVPIVRSIQ